MDLGKMGMYFVDKEEYGLVLLGGEHRNGVQTPDGESCLQTYENPYTCKRQPQGDRQNNNQAHNRLIVFRPEGVLRR